MDSPLIPSNNGSYNSFDYWQKRYESEMRSETTFDWLMDYKSIKHIVQRYVSRDNSILMLGCGNSLLSEEMFIDGYTDIHNIDYSEPVIKQMSLHCDKCSQMKWSVMDCCDLTFQSNSFDVVIEKATIDAFLSEERSHWTISDTTRTRVSLVLSEVCRVLKQPKGQFISISFYSPILRFPLYENICDSESKLSMTDICELESNFHYYCYQLIKSGEPNRVIPFTYESPKIVEIDATIDDYSNDVDHSYLFNINV